VAQEAGVARKEDRRVRRTRQRLFDALIELILEKGFDAVTVQDVLDRADVGRSTFYAHFTDKYDLLHSGHEQLQRALAEARRSAARDASPGASPRLACALVFFQLAQQFAGLYRALMGGPSGTRFRDGFPRRIADVVREELGPQLTGAWGRGVPHEVAVQFAANALTGLIRWWLEAGMPGTAEEMDHLFHELLLRGLGTGPETSLPASQEARPAGPPRDASEGVRGRPLRQREEGDDQNHDGAGDGHHPLHRARPGVRAR
jgi:AcrR family transcriptional regulator